MLVLIAGWSGGDLGVAGSLSELQGGSREYEACVWVVTECVLTQRHAKLVT